MMDTNNRLQQHARKVWASVHVYSHERSHIRVGFDQNGHVTHNRDRGCKRSSTVEVQNDGFLVTCAFAVGTISETTHVTSLEDSDWWTQSPSLQMASSLLYGSSPKSIFLLPPPLYSQDPHNIQL